LLKLSVGHLCVLSIVEFEDTGENNRSDLGAAFHLRI